MKKLKVNPEKFGWKKLFENEGLISYEKEAGKLTYNKRKLMWFILVEMGTYVPVFVGRILNNTEMEYVDRCVWLDKKAISDILITQ